MLYAYSGKHMLEVLREKREIEKNCEGQIMWSYGRDELDINNDN